VHNNFLQPSNSGTYKVIFDNGKMRQFDIAEVREMLMPDEPVDHTLLGMRVRKNFPGYGDGLFGGIIGSYE